MVDVVDLLAACPHILIGENRPYMPLHRRSGIFPCPKLEGLRGAKSKEAAFGLQQTKKRTPFAFS